MLEDNPDDAELIQFELAQAGFTFTAKVVMSENDFIHEITEYAPDIILSDYDLPRYNGTSALAEAKKQCPDVPFILITGAVTEDRAIDILTSGAKDYVMKNHLHRLAPAIHRVLEEKGEIEARKAAEEELRRSHKNLERLVAERTAERKLAEEALWQSRNHFSTLIRNIRSGVALVDGTGEFTVVNPSFLRMFGLKDDETIENVNEQNWSSWQLLESDGTLLPVSEHPIRKAAATGKAVSNKLVGVRPPAGGDVTWMLISADPVLKSDGTIQSTICTCHDLSELRQSELAGQNALQRFYSLISGMRGAVLLVDEDKIEFINQTFCDYINIKESPSELIGLSSSEIIEKIRNIFLYPNQEVNRIAEIVRRGQPVIGEEVALREGKTCLRDFVPILVNEKLHGHFWYHVDITLRKRAENSLQEYTAKLEESNRELESFSYSVSHDLRAPLRAIEGYTRMILKKQGNKFDEETDRYFDQIRISAKAMNRLIDDLLTLSRLGRQDLDVRFVDIQQLIEEIWRELRSADSGRSIDLKINYLPSGWGDRGLLKQVFVNFLSNSQKFTRVRDTAQVEVGGYENGNWNIYYVKDNGVGFNMAYYDKLFGVFQRLHSASEYEGTGIGLALVSRIIRRHGGRVWAQGKVNEGAAFYFNLPGKGEDNY